MDGQHSALDGVEILTKIRKRKSLEVIAEEVEGTSDAIWKIYERLIKEVPNK